MSVSCSLLTFVVGLSFARATFNVQTDHLTEFMLRLVHNSIYPGLKFTSNSRVAFEMLVELNLQITTTEPWNNCAVAIKVFYARFLYASTERPVLGTCLVLTNNIRALASNMNYGAVQLVPTLFFLRFPLVSCSLLLCCLF